MFVITAPFRSGLLRLAHPFVAATVIGPSQLVVKFKMRSARRIFGRLRGACAQCNARGQGGCPSTRLAKKESLMSVSSVSEEEVVHVVVGGQGLCAHGARLDALDDLLAGEVEDRLEDLRVLLAVCLPRDEEHAGAVLDVAGAEELPLEELHDDGRLGAVKAARVAAAVQLGEERVRPLVVGVPQLLEQLFREAGTRLDLEGVLGRDESVPGEGRAVWVAGL